MSDLEVLVNVLFSSPGLLHQVSSSFLTFLSQKVMPSELVTQQLLEICVVNAQVFHSSVSHHAKISRMVLDLPMCQ